jgi:Ulp1 family protease
LPNLASLSTVERREVTRALGLYPRDKIHTRAPDLAPRDKILQTLTVRDQGQPIQITVTALNVQHLQPTTWLDDDTIKMYVLLAIRCFSKKKDDVRFMSSQWFAQLTIETTEISDGGTLSTSEDEAEADQVSREEKRKGRKSTNKGPPQEYVQRLSRTWNPCHARVAHWTRPHEGRTRGDRACVLGARIVVVPINEGNQHWTLGVIDFEKHQIMYANSLCCSPEHAHKRLSALRLWLRDEIAADGHRTCSHPEYDDDLWTCVHLVDIPRQTNGCVGLKHRTRSVAIGSGAVLQLTRTSLSRAPDCFPRYDCGLFLCKYVECICRGWALESQPFQQTDMVYIRQRVLLSLLHNEIM